MDLSESFWSQEAPGTTAQVSFSRHHSVVLSHFFSLRSDFAFLLVGGTVGNKLYEDLSLDLNPGKGKREGGKYMFKITFFFFLTSKIFFSFTVCKKNTFSVSSSFYSSLFVHLDRTPGKEI